MTIGPTMIPRLADQAIYRIFGDEAVILDVDAGHYYTLNASGSEIWAQCDGKNDLQRIADSLCGEFDVTPERAWAALSRFFADLVQAGLVELDSPRQNP